MKKTRTHTTYRPTFLPASVLRVLDRLSFRELEELCDDPKRNQTGEEVEAIITPHASGYAVTIRDTALSFTLVDENDQPVVFRSIERALDRLSEVPFLPMAKIDLEAWGKVH